MLTSILIGLTVFGALVQECVCNLPPVFQMDMNNLAISEKTKVNTVIYRLEGSDPENSPVHFGLEGTDVLRVDPDTGVVTVVKPLDYEVNDTLNVIVSIEDEVKSGDRNNVVEVPIAVIILDENDNAPQFQNAPYEILVFEDAAVSSTMFSNISVMDRDSTGQNIEVECINLPEYQDACDIFTIIPVISTQSTFQGSLILSRKLNYAAKNRYEFILKASDGDLTTTTNVTVNVGDIQDTPPIFIGNFNAEISENAPINTLILTVYAEDGDRGVPRKIAYQLVNNPMNYFLLDAVTGELRIAKPLDREAINNPDNIIKLTITANELVDGVKINDPLTVATTEAVILVKDVNDEKPKFNKKEYFVEIPENIPEGTALPGLDMIVSDPDEGNNSAFSLRLIDISNAFNIEPEKALGSQQVTVRVANNNSLDYEDLNERKFILTVIAEELYTKEKYSSMATITVSVTDINDNAPTFEHESYSATISEIATPRTLVTTIVAEDRDSGTFGENGIIYRLSGNGAESFVVNNRTGTITVADCEELIQHECLDYETKPEFQLQFIATDDDGKGQTTMVPLHITLADNNDNPPVFAESVYSVSVNEGAVRFEPDVIIAAKDADITSHLTYSIIAGNDKGLFTIDANTGKLRIINNAGLGVGNGTIDSIVLTVMASDSKYTSTASVNITIKDVNNNVPAFSRQNYVVSVPEDIDIGSSIVQLQASDMDIGNNSLLSYGIQKGAYEDFAIDESNGIISVAKKLDFDKRNTYNIEVLAVDHGEPVLTGTSTLTVNVVNVNDKLPYFAPTTQNAEIFEDALVGTVVHTLVALDPDVNSSEALNFEASDPVTALDKNGNQVLHTDIYKEWFEIDKRSGKVTLIKPLERDLAALLRITVVVTDITAAVVQQGKGLLVITINDVNDSPPIFLPPWTPDNQNYYLQLKEEQPVGTIVATYKAIDEDSDISSYIIEPENPYFTVNHGTGIVQIRQQIDYEKTKELSFTLIAFDSGVPQLNVSATVNIEVVNLNDNSPIFSNDVYNTSIDENAPNGTLIVGVFAKDLDSGEFGEVTYSLTGEHSENFVISPTTGDIFVANSNFLDHEMLNRTVIQVVASDGGKGNNKRSVSVPINIKINDVNDNAPVFNQSSYNVTVLENIRLNPPVPILQVNASDLDSGLNGNIHYSIVEGNDNDAFLIGMDTGILYPHKSLLGHTHDFHLVVEARDGAGHGQLYDRAIVNVQVLNVNEYKPVFSMPTSANATVEVPENSATENYLVMTVKAYDKDNGENGRITFHLQVNNENVQENNEFTIDPNSGELRSKIFLDRESKSKYELILVARDHGYPKWYQTETHLTILLVDTNDNRPEFPDSKTANPYHFYVQENNERNLKIGQVKALDRDEGTHARVYYYFLSGNEDHSFYLDRLDGFIYTNKSFDRELQSEYNLFILANNDPEFYLTPREIQQLNEEDILHDGSVAKVKVTILDLNDNPPSFENSKYYAAVNAMANLNTYVANVSAFDPDQGLNGTVTYYVKGANLYKYGSNKSSGSIIPSPFNITQGGTISTATYLAENNQHRFVIDVIAREDAFPQREAYTQVEVWVFEPEQLIRVILSRPPEEVRREREEIIAELGNATQGRVIIDEIRYHTDDNGNKNDEWSDMYLLIISLKNSLPYPVPSLLHLIDSQYDYLHSYYAGFAIENVVPALPVEEEERWEPALAALVALLMVLVVGIAAVVAACCCLRRWVRDGEARRKEGMLIKKQQVVDEMGATENPLWIEQKLKIYEEQELTMQVFTEPEQNALTRNNADDFIPDENAYATIQHPYRRGSSHMATLSLRDDLADYATLSGVPRQSGGSSQSSLRGAPNYYEAAMGFQGSTFQVPDRLDSNDYEPFGTKFKGSELTINHEGQPEYVAELI